MRVLWFVNIELIEIAEEFGRCICTGGWLNTIASQVAAQMEIELYVACPCSTDVYDKYEKNGIKYYSFKNPLHRRLEEIIAGVQPDLVHIWGTEYEHAYIATCILEKFKLLNHTVVSIQGLVSIIGQYHYVTGIPSTVVYGRTLAELIFRKIYPNIIDERKNMIRQGQKERIIIQKNKYCIGRTDFDKACISQINPLIMYFHCNETLRKGFYKKRWDIKQCKQHSIFLSQSYYPVKGVHIFLEALEIIKREYPDVTVKIVGKDIFAKNDVKDIFVNRSYPRYLRKLIKQYALQNCIEWLGQQTEEEMIEQYCSSNVFVSASIIENSSNSVGEAMLLGMPIVASDVGGIKSLLEHNKEGILYQETAPYMLADGVIRIFKDDVLACQLGENAHQRAYITYDQQRNLDSLLKIYREIIYSHNRKNEELCAKYR